MLTLRCELWVWGFLDFVCVSCVAASVAMGLHSFNSRGLSLNYALHLLRLFAAVPDEESGGGKGMSPFIQHDKFKEIKWGVVFDEGM